MCDQFQEKLLNNDKMRSFLDWIVRDEDGEFASGFIAMLLNFLAPVGHAIWNENTLAADVANPANGAVWVEANGQKLLQADYARLYAVYGTAYNQGGDNDATEFRVPNLAGKFAFGRDGSHAVRSTGGEESVTLVEAELPAHTHYVAANDKNDNTVLDATHAIARRRNIGVEEDYKFANADDDEEATIGLSSPVGNGEAHENMPPYVAGIWYVLAGYNINSAMV